MSATTGATKRTGASDEQIEAGAKRYFVVYENSDPDAYREWEQVKRHERAIYLEIAEEVLNGACPVGSAIVPLATHNALVAFANAEAAYRAARRTLAGFEAEWRAREAAWEALGKVGRG